MTTRRRCVEAFLCCALCSAMVAAAQAETTAFYYGPAVPPELSVAYDQVVVEPGHVPDVRALAERGAVAVAYFSIGELTTGDLAGTDPAWRLGRNEAWNSAVMDLENSGYRAHALDRFEALWNAGYRRFFLDTLDSYRLGVRDEAARERQRLALCGLITEMAGRHPDARLLLNRGFELLPQVHHLVHGVVAESLFDRWDAANARYVRVPKDDRVWLVDRLREVQRRYDLPVIVIDYRPRSERARARTTARKIAALGFQPWVCNAALDDVGIGPVEILPRRVLVLTDRAQATAQAGVARWLAPVLEYLGYFPIYRRIADGLPEQVLTDRVAGVITVFQPGVVFAKYEQWLLRQLHAGVRVAIFGGLGFGADSEAARELGIVALAPSLPGTRPPEPVRIASRDPLIGFEAEPPLRDVEGVPVRIRGNGVIPHLELRTRDGSIATAIATTRYGGLALSHVLALRGLAGERGWVLDPFAFLESALGLPAMPVPDLTTENGRRVALFAIDAQGLADRARLRGRPRIAHVLRTRFLAKHPWPHAMSSTETPSVSRADVAAARALSQSGATYDGEIAEGSTAVRGVAPLLTGIEPLWDADDETRIPAPIASDASYLEGASEAYPLRRVIETFEYTDAPRRLRPLALHYHAYALSSPGGLDALEAVYGWLEKQALFPIRLSDYWARVEAFREQVIGRALDGSFGVYGGEALRTVRVPASFGELSPGRSMGVADSATLPQGRYVTFAAHGPRRIGFRDGSAVRQLPTDARRDTSAARVTSRQSARD